MDEEDEKSPISGTAHPREGRWKPGQSGNPGGRPKWKPYSEAMQAIIEEHPAVMKELATAMLAKAAKGDVSAAALIWDRLEGKVATTIGGSTDLGPVKLVLAWEK